MATNLAHELEKALPLELLSVLRAAGEICQERGVPLYLVGGMVRDLILGRRSFDLDLVVEGDAADVAKALAHRGGGTVVMCSQFGTAKVRHGETTVDLATARAETYSRPGALPTVRPGTIKEDLLRRDFTVNAIAMRLDQEAFGELLDPCEGQEDIKRRCIRVLHDKSFIDDATRMFRAVRYEQRLSFVMEPQTENLLRRDVAVLKTISADRLRHEIELILKEEEPEKALRRADDLGLMQQIYPPLKIDSWLEDKFRRARTMLSSPSMVYLLLMGYRLTPAQGQEFARSLKFARTVAQGVQDTLRLRDNLSALAQPQLSPSDICKLSEEYSTSVIMTCAVASGEPLISERLRLYLDKLRHVSPSLNGKALQAMGVASGEPLGEMLKALRWAKIDNRVTTRDEEAELVRSWLSKGQGG